MRYKYTFHCSPNSTDDFADFAAVPSPKRCLDIVVLLVLDIVLSFVAWFLVLLYCGVGNVQETTGLFRKVHGALKGV